MLEIVFLTSNRVKFEHLCYLARGFNIKFLTPPDYGKPYHEPRIYDRDRLLRESIESANEKLYKKNLEDRLDATSSLPNFINREKVTRREMAKIYQEKFFIIEDTSVIVNALSDKVEVPGVDVKYWMRGMSFGSLDRMLNERGGDRSVRVRSDLVLYIPEKFRDKSGDVYKVFTGCSNGVVVSEEPSVETNALYPWLDNKTFNKWFVPEGANDVLSNLEIDVATRFDFRAKAFEALNEYLTSKNLVAKIQPESSDLVDYQFSLFGENSFIICGPTCSGKSTIAEYLVKKYGYFHIEASDFMHVLYYKRSPKGSPAHDIHDFAKKVLENEPEAVASEVKEFIARFSIQRYVISGFRSPKELRPFIREINKGFAHLIYLDADQYLRFDRNVKRARPDAVSSMVDFIYRDSLQQSMGLSDFSSLRCSRYFENNGSISIFHTNFAREFLFNALEVSFVYDIRSGSELEANLEDCILLALYRVRESTDYFTTTQVASLINQSFKRIKSGRGISTHKDNVSRYFNMNLHPYYRIKAESGKNMYRLSATGASRARQLIVKFALS